VDVGQQGMVQPAGPGILQQLLGLRQGKTGFGILLGRVGVHGGAGDALVQPGLRLQQQGHGRQRARFAKTTARFRIVLEDQRVQLPAVDQAPCAQRANGLISRSVGGQCRVVGLGRRFRQRAIVGDCGDLVLQHRAGVQVRGGPLSGGLDRLHEATERTAQPGRQWLVAKILPGNRQQLRHQRRFGRS